MTLGAASAPVLYIPPPAHALLDAPGMALYAKDLADALGRFGIPSVAGKADTPSWQLLIAAAQDGDHIIPAYHILGPNHEVYGKLEGTPVPADGWLAGDKSLLAQAATEDSQGLSKLLAQINARVQLNSPDSLVNRPARVFVGDITGTPYDTSIALPETLSQQLATSGLKVVHAITAADFRITGEVKTIPVASGQIIIQLNWFVHDSNGRFVGQVVQLHELKAADLPSYWQGMGAATTPQAVSGIKNVIQNDLVKKPGAAQAAQH